MATTLRPRLGPAQVRNSAGSAATSDYWSQDSRVSWGTVSCLVRYHLASRYGAHYIHRPYPCGTSVPSLLLNTQLTVNSQIGAGPSGLVAALTIAQNGVPVRIIDKAHEFHQASRGGGLHVRIRLCLEIVHLTNIF